LIEETFTELDLDVNNVDDKMTYQLLKYYIMASIVKNNTQPEAPV
jgi:hypothetical protein